MTEHFYVRDPLKPGMCGEDVRFIQELINAQGIEVPVSGVFDDSTIAAARELRIRNMVEEAKFFRAPNSPKNDDRPGLEWVTEKYFDGDVEASERWQRAQDPESFLGPQEYEAYLRSEPSPLPDFIFLHDVQTMRRGGGVAILETDVPPPGSDPYCRVMTSDAGGTSVTNLALFEEIRKQLPANIGDDRAVEATLRAMQDGIKTPDLLQNVVVANDRIFVIGNVPGYRGVVDLKEPPLPTTEIETQMAALEHQRQTEREQSKRSGPAFG